MNAGMLSRRGIITGIATACSLGPLITLAELASREPILAKGLIIEPTPEAPIVVDSYKIAFTSRAGLDVDLGVEVVELGAVMTSEAAEALARWFDACEFRSCRLPLWADPAGPRWIKGDFRLVELSTSARRSQPGHRAEVTLHALDPELVWGPIEPSVATA